MPITHTWNISNTPMVSPSLGGKADVITGCNWSLQSTDGTNINHDEGFVEFSPPNENYTEFAEVTPALVSAWLFARLNKADIEGRAERALLAMSSPAAPKTLVAQ